MGRRFGTFLILIGVALIGLYVLFDVAKTPRFIYFVVGGMVILGGVGLILVSPKPPPPPPAGRFQMIQRLKNRPKKKP